MDAEVCVWWWGGGGGGGWCWSANERPRQAGRQLHALAALPPFPPPAHQASQSTAPSSTSASVLAVSPARRAMLPTAQAMQGMPVMLVWSGRPSRGLYWPAGQGWHWAAPSPEKVPAGLQARGTTAGGAGEAVGTAAHTGQAGAGGRQRRQWPAAAATTSSTSISPLPQPHQRRMGHEEATHHGSHVLAASSRAVPAGQRWHCWLASSYCMPTPEGSNRGARSA